MSIKPYELRNGNCKELIKQLADNTIDAIVTDPPYELGFMGKKWDATGIAYDAELWAECLRVLKPGGHLLAFSGSRTYHRMAVAIEDAGFDIRDQIMWVYGSGFPKSHDVSKAIDKMAGAERERTGNYTNKKAGLGRNNIMSKFVSKHMDPKNGKIFGTAPATDAAKEWNGWGTALKPAHEPICVARKPLIGTVAENVLQYGTGALNIGGCRVYGTTETKEFDIARTGYKKGIDHISKATANERGEINSNIGIYGYKAREHCKLEHVNLGRWPANLIHDGSAEVLAGFPETASHGKIYPHHNDIRKNDNYSSLTYKGWRENKTERGFDDRGSAARFFYCAKASKRDRDEGCGELEIKKGGGLNSTVQGDSRTGQISYHRNNHPTVKPTDLMRYLCRLVTPPNGLILDPFTGSGSTGKAAILEGFRFLGFEMEPQYIEISTARIEYAIEQKSKQKTEQENTLFGGENE